LEPRALLSAPPLAGSTTPPVTSLPPFAGATAAQPGTSGNAGPQANSGLQPAASQPGGGAAQTASPNGNVTPINPGGPGPLAGANTLAVLTTGAVATPAALTGPATTAGPGQPPFGPLFTAAATTGAPFAGVRPTVEQGQAIGVRTGPMSFSQLDIPGSQTSPMAELPPVPFAYITGPVTQVAGPVSRVPTFAVDVARVNAGVGEGTPEGNSESASLAENEPAPTESILPASVQPLPTLPVLPLLPMPLEGGQDSAPEQVPQGRVPQVPPSTDTGWAGASAAYFAVQARETPARPALPVLPLGLDEAPPAPAVAGLVTVLGGAFCWHPEWPDRRTRSKRRGRLGVALALAG